MARRRDLLAALAGSVFASGCSSFGDSTRTESSESVTTLTQSQTTTRTTTDTETATRTTTLEPQQRLSFGEWYEWDNWRFSPQSLELITEYQLDDTGETRELPDGTQMVISEIHLKKKLIDDAWIGGEQFAFILDDERIVTTEETDFTEDLPNPVNLQRIEHFSQFSNNHGYHLEEGELGKMWYVTFTPASKTKADIEVGFEPRFNDPHLYPIRWTRTN